MTTVSDRRPVWLTPQLEEDLYQRWREWMVAVARRGGILIAHPKWQGIYGDFLERLTADVMWYNAIPLLMDKEPMMMFRIEIPEDDLLIWTSKEKVQTPVQFFGDVGFGRLTASAPREGGVMPWSEAKVPKGATKAVTPDVSEDQEA